MWNKEHRFQSQSVLLFGKLWGPIRTVYHYLLTRSFNYPVPSSKISSSVCCGGTSTVYLIGTVRRTEEAGWSPVNPDRLSLKDHANKYVASHR